MDSSRGEVALVGAGVAPLLKSFERMKTSWLTRFVFCFTIMLAISIVSEIARATDCDCRRDSLSEQAKILKQTLHRLKVSPKRDHATAQNPGPESWPSSMLSGNASYYGGTPTYARAHGLQYWAATPIKRGIPKGICLIVTNKDLPKRHVRLVTADVGGFDRVKNRVLDLSVSAAKELDPNYGSKGVLNVSVQPIPCDRQS